MRTNFNNEIFCPNIFINLLQKNLVTTKYDIMEKKSNLHNLRVCMLPVSPSIDLGDNTVWNIYLWLSVYNKLRCFLSAHTEHDCGALLAGLLVSVIAWSSSYSLGQNWNFHYFKLGLNQGKTDCSQCVCS